MPAGQNGVGTIFHDRIEAIYSTRDSYLGRRPCRRLCARPDVVRRELAPDRATARCDGGRARNANRSSAAPGRSFPGAVRLVPRCGSMAITVTPPRNSSRPTRPPSQRNNRHSIQTRSRTPVGKKQSPKRRCRNWPRPKPRRPKRNRIGPPNRCPPRPSRSLRKRRRISRAPPKRWRSSLLAGGQFGGGFNAPPVNTPRAGYDFTAEFRERVSSCSSLPTGVSPARMSAS